MEIQLKNIKHSESLSQETNAFTADLWIDGVKIGPCDNHGTGGPTNYNVYNYKDWPIIKKAEAYCNTLPPINLGELGTLPNDLENVIDDLLTKHLIAKDIAKFKKKMEKDMIQHIVCGVKSDEVAVYRVFKLPLTIEKYLSHPKGKPWLIETLKTIQLKLEHNEVILNSNIPAEIIEAATATPQQ